MEFLDDAILILSSHCTSLFCLQSTMGSPLVIHQIDFVQQEGIRLAFEDFGDISSLKTLSGYSQ